MGNGKSSARDPKYFRNAIVGVFVLMIACLVYNILIDIGLINAAQTGDTASVRKLLAMHASPDSKDADTEASALTLAASNGYSDIVKVLIASGANVNSIDDHNRTALMSAVSNGHTDIVDLLIAHGANVNAVDYYGETALTCASKYHYISIAHALKSAGEKK